MVEVRSSPTLRTIPFLIANRTGSCSHEVVGMGSSTDYPDFTDSERPNLRKSVKSADPLFFAAAEGRSRFLACFQRTGLSAFICVYQRFQK